MVRKPLKLPTRTLEVRPSTQLRVALPMLAEARLRRIHPLVLLTPLESAEMKVVTLRRALVLTLRTWLIEKVVPL